MNSRNVKITITATNQTPEQKKALTDARDVGTSTVPSRNSDDLVINKQWSEFINKYVKLRKF